LKVELQVLQLKIDTATLSRKRALKTVNILLWELEPSVKELLRILIRWLFHLPQAKDPPNCQTVLRPLQALTVIEGRALKTQTPNLKEISI
jgi:hypothetical protein